LYINSSNAVGQGGTNLIPQWKSSTTQSELTVNPSNSLSVEVDVTNVGIPGIVRIEVLPTSGSVQFVKTQFSTYNDTKTVNQNNQIAGIEIPWVPRDIPLTIMYPKYSGDLMPYDMWVNMLHTINYAQVPVPLVFFNFVLYDHSLGDYIMIVYDPGPLQSDKQAFITSATNYLYDILKSIVKNGGTAGIPFTMDQFGNDFEFRPAYQLGENVVIVAAKFNYPPLASVQDSYNTLFDFTKLPFSVGILANIASSSSTMFVLGGVSVTSVDTSWTDNIYWKDSIGKFEAFPITYDGTWSDLCFWKTYGVYGGFFTYGTVASYLLQISSGIPTNLGGITGIMVGIDFRYAIGQLDVKWTYPIS
jgi:hypothetical protein